MKPQRVNSMSGDFRWGVVVITVSMSIVNAVGAFAGDYLSAGKTSLSSLFEAPFDLSRDPQVGTYIDRFVTTGREETEASLGRALYYFPLIEERLEWYKLPTALKYLPLVESMLRPEVTSPVGAAGIWQLMPVTARHFGLVINENLDERRDFFASTEAAAKLLAFLYQDFKDWHLVLAAYNCGPGRVRKAIRRANSREYPDIMPFLPVQTRNYISKFNAMAHVAANSGLYGLQPRLPEMFVLPRQILHIRESRSIAQLANFCGISAQLIRKYNPAYIGHSLPRRAVGYRLVLPVDAANEYYVYCGESGLRESAIAAATHKADAQPLVQKPLPVEAPLKQQTVNSALPGRMPAEERDVPFTRYYFSRRWQDAA